MMFFIIDIQGSPQWIQITPTTSITLNNIAIKFQGGFAARRFVIEYRQEDGTFAALGEFYPDDHGKLQISFFLFLTFRIVLEKKFKFLNIKLTSLVFQQHM